MTTTTTTTSFQHGVKAIRMTAEQVKADSAKEYNQQVWERNVDSYSKYENVEFYKVCKNAIFEYDRFFVVYTLPEGLRLLSNFGYSSSLTNGGFFKVLISDMHIVVDDNGDIVSYNTLEDDNVYIKIHKIRFGDGKEGAIDTDNISRKLMTQHSKSINQIWTKEYFTA